MAPKAQSKTVKIPNRDVSIPTGLFINNDFVKATSGATFPVENPTNGQELLQIEEGRGENKGCVLQHGFACASVGR